MWSEIRGDAVAQSREQSWRTLDLHEFGIDDFLSREVLNHRSLACGLAAGVGGKLSANSPSPSPVTPTLTLTLP